MLQYTEAQQLNVLNGILSVLYCVVRLTCEGTFVWIWQTLPGKTHNGKAADTPVLLWKDSSKITQIMVWPLLKIV